MKKEITWQLNKMFSQIIMTSRAVSLRKSSKDKSQEWFEEIILKYQCLALELKKKQWGKSGCIFHSDNLWFSTESHLIASIDFK